MDLPAYPTDGEFARDSRVVSFRDYDGAAMPDLPAVPPGFVRVRGEIVISRGG
jgi:hypothetical protein